MLGNEPCMWIKLRNSDFLSTKGGIKLLKTPLRYLALPVVALCKAAEDISDISLDTP